jgi:hypothetical protein
LRTPAPKLARTRWKAGFMFASVEHMRGLVGPIGGSLKRSITLGSPGGRPRRECSAPLVSPAGRC